MSFLVWIKHRVNSKLGAREHHTMMTTNIVVENRKSIDKTKRKRPMAHKQCDNCLRKFCVPSSKQSCKDKTCAGFLELVRKELQEPQEPQVLKRDAPVCDKHCDQCGKWYLQVACATKKCKCGDTLSKVSWPTGRVDAKLFIEPID